LAVHIEINRTYLSICNKEVKLSTRPLIFQKL